VGAGLIGITRYRVRRMLRGCTLRVDCYMYRCDTSDPITKAASEGEVLGCIRLISKPVTACRNKCEMLLNLIETKGSTAVIHLYFICSS
jgi:hypothetical protein